jgi:hypothetical protein
MRNDAPRFEVFRRRAMLRLVGALLSCAVAWQIGAPVNLIGEPALSCCLKTHDDRKCPCRYCVHDRSPGPLLEACGLQTAPAQPVVGIQVFTPAQHYFAPPPVAAAAPEGELPAAVLERSLEVPTPPPLA